MKEPLEQVKVDARLICPSHWWCHMAGYGSVGGLGAWGCSTPAALMCSGGWYSGWMPGDFCWGRLGAWPSGLIASLVTAGMLLVCPMSALEGPALYPEPGVQVVVVAQVEAAPEALPPLENGPVACPLDEGRMLNETGSRGCAIGVDDVVAGGRHLVGAGLGHPASKGEAGTPEGKDHAQSPKAPVLAVQAGRGNLAGKEDADPTGTQAKRKHARRGTGIEVAEGVFTGEGVKGLVDDWLVDFLTEALMNHTQTGGQEG